MARVKREQAKAAYEKYQAEHVDDTTSIETFTLWLEANDEAFERYVNDNKAVIITKTLENFKASVAAAKSGFSTASTNVGVGLIQGMEAANSLSALQAQVRNLKNNSLASIPDELPPAASPYFVGRTKELTALESHFKSKGQSIMAVQGMGGSGKSQLAAEYAHLSKISQNPYRLVRWLKADSEENLKNSYFGLGDDLGIEREEYKDSEAALRKAIHLQLLRYESVLLIYDNVESLDHLEGYQPSAGGNTSIHMLITTRNRFVDCPTIEVKEFTGIEVQSYLNKRLKKDVPLALADQLGQELGYLPLAIVQSGAYMVKYAKSPESFLKLLQTENRQKVLGGDPKLKTVATLWDMTLEKLSPQGLELIRLCSYLDPDNVPQNLLEQMVAEGQRDEVLFELRSQSLLIETGGDKELFRIHRLLQEAVRRQLVQQDNSGMIAKAIVEKGVEALKVVIGESGNKSGTDLYLFWKERDFIALQVRRLIVEGEKLKIQEILLATLLEWAGEYQRHITLNYTESLKLCQQSLAILIASYGDSHQWVARSLNNLGNIYDSQAQYEKALECFERSLSIRKSIYGDNHPDVAESLSYVGLVYKAQGQYEKALGCLDASLAIRKIVYGNNHPEVAEGLRNTGLIYKAQGQYEKALECLDASLAIRKAVYGDNHPEVAESLNGIGLICKAQDQYKKALGYFEQALAIRKATYGDNHPRVAISVNCIGSVYEAQGEYDKALKYFEQALAIRKATYGDSHQSVARTLNGIGLVYKAQGQHEKALEYFEQSLAIQKATYGDSTVRLVATLNCIGGVYEAKGQYEKAMPYYERCLAIQKATYGDNHPEIAKSLKNIDLVNKRLKLQENAPLLFSGVSNQGALVEMFDTQLDPEELEGPPSSKRLKLPLP